MIINKKKGKTLTSECMCGNKSNNNRNYKNINSNHNYCNSNNNK